MGPDGRPVGMEKVDEQLMMRTLMDQSNPGSRAAAQVYQQYQAAGKSKGEALQAMARAYKQATGQDMPGAPTGALLDASATFHQNLAEEKRQAAAAAEQRSRELQQQQAVKAAEQKNSESVKAALAHCAGMEEPAKRLAEPRSSGGFDSYDDKVRYVKSLGALSVGQIKYLADHGGWQGATGRVDCAVAAYPGCTNKHLWRDLADALNLSGNKTDLLNRTCGQ